jgi:hypothetical protein
MNQESEQEITVHDFRERFKGYWKYLLSKAALIIMITIVFGILGVTYAWMQKPVYKAELTYAAATERSMTGYSGLAMQLGIDFAMQSSVFEGENLMQLLKSRLLLEKTFLTPILVDGKNELLINYYILSRGMGKGLSGDSLNKLFFKPDYKPGVRAKDSLMKKFCNDIAYGSLQIQRVDRRLDIVSVSLMDNDEFFVKNFVEQLANNAIQYYVDYKIKKARQNVEILQKQTDSVRSLITGSIVSIAVSNDLNVNPARQIMQVGTQRKQVDVQVNSSLYTELVKNLEFSRMNLRRETPLIQIIDTPVFPLEKKKLGRLKGGIIFAFLGGLLALIFFVLKKTFRF